MDHVYRVLPSFGRFFFVFSWQVCVSGSCLCRSPRDHNPKGDRHDLNEWAWRKRRSAIGSSFNEEKITAGIRGFFAVFCRRFVSLFVRFPLFFLFYNCRPPWQRSWPAPKVLPRFTEFLELFYLGLIYNVFYLFFFKHIARVKCPKYVLCLLIYFSSLDDDFGFLQVSFDAKWRCHFTTSLLLIAASGT